jgi:hypothetical protein
MSASFSSAEVLETLVRLEWRESFDQKKIEVKSIRFARFFLVHDTKTGKNVPMVINFPKSP